MPWISGWKRIAAYMACSVRTAKDYRAAGCPVRRNPYGYIIAKSEELDAWLIENPGDFHKNARRKVYPVI